MPRYENRMQLALALVVGLLLLANLFTLALVALAPATRSERAPILFTVFIITLAISVPIILLLPRWLLRPYRQLVDEAERAPVTSATRERTRDETEFVLETFQDVVAELRAKQRELERLSARASARAATAEQFSERVVASLPSGLLAFNAEGRSTVVNSPARAILGLDGVHDEEEDFRTLLACAPELVALVERCLQTGETYKREEVSAKIGGGRARRLGVTVAPIDPTRSGGERGALCTLTDITEVAELRETVARKRNLESLGEMSAGLAHEFKNALATLHGYAQLLQNAKMDEGARASSTAALLQEVRGLSEMVTSFLNFARPKPPDFGDVSLAEVLELCAADLSAFFDERRISFNIEGEFADVHADERMLRQALLNLVRNAAEAIPDTESNRRVTVTGKIKQDDDGRAWTTVEIEDTGTGVAEEDLQNIFIPFFTTKSKGHGVGLALAHRVATDHGGTLSASNSTSGGAIFTLRLPA
jgi:nitrogen fixation/metabolism regulation signal transduction histidine kinase